MTADETTEALLALFYAHRARHATGTRRNDKRQRRAAFVEVHYQNGLPVRIYRKAARHG